MACLVQSLVMPVRNFRSQQLKLEQIRNAVLEVATVAQEDCVRVCVLVVTKGVLVLLKYCVPT